MFINNITMFIKIHHLLWYIDMTTLDNMRNSRFTIFGNFQFRIKDAVDNDSDGLF